MRGGTLLGFYTSLLFDRVSLLGAISAGHANRRAQCHEPIAAFRERLAVELVVRLDFIEQGVVTQTPKTLIDDDAVTSSGHHSRSRLIEIKRFNILDGITRLRNAYRFAHHFVEVHELVPAQEVVDSVSRVP